MLTQRKQKLRWWGGLTTLVLMWGIGCTLNFYPRLLKSKNVCWVAWEIRVTQLTFWLYISSCFHLEITRNHLKIDKIQEGALPYGDLIYTVPPKWTYIFLHLKTLLKQSNSHHTIYPSVYVSLLNNWPHDLMTASSGSQTSAISIPNTVFSQYCIPYQVLTNLALRSRGQIPYPVDEFCIFFLNPVLNFGSTPGSWECHSRPSLGRQKCNSSLKIRRVSTVSHQTA